MVIYQKVESVKIHLMQTKVFQRLWAMLVSRKDNHLHLPISTFRAPALTPAFSPASAAALAAASAPNSKDALEMGPEPIVINGVVWGPYKWLYKWTTVFFHPYFSGVISPILITGDFRPILKGLLYEANPNLMHYL